MAKGLQPCRYRATSRGGNTTQDEYIVERPGYSYITLPCDVTYELPDAIEHAYPGFYNTGALSEFDQQHFLFEIIHPSDKVN